MKALVWKYFRQSELREAEAHADAGGIAVHESGRRYRGKPAAHLLADTRRALMNAADEVGVEAKHLQTEPRAHFDLYGGPYMEALRLCIKDDPQEDEGPDVRRCRICGCTDMFGCADGCYWVEEDLCSNCQGKT